MNKEGTKVRIIVKSLINDLVIEVNQSSSSFQELTMGKLKVLRYLIDTYMDNDSRITDEELEDIWEKEVNVNIISVQVI